MNVFSKIRVYFINIYSSREITGTVRLMKEMNVWVGPIVHESILGFYMCFFSLPPGGVIGVIWISSYFLNTWHT